MGLSEAKAKLEFYSYRLSTIAKSLKALYNLPPEKVSSFVQSYEIYNYDWANEKQIIKEFGKDYYGKVQQKIIDYYSVINLLCSIGQVEKMYIPPAMDLTRSIIANQSLFEEKMCFDLNIPKKGKVLDIGCGRGRIASHIASISGAHVTGMNIDSVQLEDAKRFAARSKLHRQCKFIKADLNEIPFPFADNSFDAIYQVQVFSYSKNLPKLFKELHRILKPGAKLGCLDWVHLENYNPKDPHHLDLMGKVKPLIGAIGTPSVEEYASSMKKAGFKILINRNASIDGLQAPLIEKADQFYTRITKIIHFLVQVKILPAHFKTLFDRLVQDGNAFVEADRLRLLTTSHYFVAQKS